MSDTRKSPPKKTAHRGKSRKSESKTNSKRPRTLLVYCNPALWGFDRRK
jgi:hypothetical protein